MDVPTLPLIVAALAVIVSPTVSWCVAQRQIRSALEASNKQIVAPMRQAWINKLRELLAELTANTMHARVVGGITNRTDEDNKRLFLLLGHIQLMLNPNEDDHKNLEMLMQKVVGELRNENGTHDKLSALRCDLLALSRKILKREWDRVRKPMSAASTAG